MQEYPDPFAKQTSLATSIMTAIGSFFGLGLGAAFSLYSFIGFIYSQFRIHKDYGWWSFDSLIQLMSIPYALAWPYYAINDRDLIPMYSIVYVYEDNAVWLHQECTPFSRKDIERMDKYLPIIGSSDSMNCKAGIYNKKGLYHQIVALEFNSLDNCKVALSRTDIPQTYDDFRAEISRSCDGRS